MIKNFTAVITAIAMLFGNLALLVVAQEYTNLNNPIVDPKPYDYNRVLFEDDFENPTIDTTSWEVDSANAAVESNDTTTVSSKEQGSYVNIASESVSGNNDYLRIKYGSSTAPVQSSGVALSDLGRVQFSFDICPMVEKEINLRFLDKWSDSSSTKGETLIILKKNGTMTFSGSSTTKQFVLREWMTFDIFFDFDFTTPANSKYSVYLNGDAVVKNVSLSTLRNGVEAVSVLLGSEAPTSYSVYFDNLKIAIPETFKIVSSEPMHQSTDVNVLNNAAIQLSNKISNTFLPGLVTVEAGGNDISSNCSIHTEQNSIIVDFPNNIMDFGTSYTITLDGNITDIYGSKLTEDKVITYDTMAPMLTVSAPLVSTDITAKVINPGETKNVVLAVTVTNSDGSFVFYEDDEDVTSSDGVKTLRVNFDVSSLTEGQVAASFVGEGNGSYKPIQDVYVTADGSTYSSEGNTAVSANIESAQVSDTQVIVNGRISAAESQVVILKISSELTGNVVAAVPITTGNSGEFTYSIDNMPEGDYEVILTGYNVVSSNGKDFTLLSDATKETIRCDVNDAAVTGASDVKGVLNTWKSKIKLDNAVYNQNTYNVLTEQAPFASYNDILTMISDANRLMAEVNASDWSGYINLFTENKDIILHDVEELTDYDGFSNNKKNDVNKIVVEKSPFDTFAALRKEFKEAVAYIKNPPADTTKDDSKGGGGGGGGILTVTKPQETPQEAPEKQPQNLFVDLDNAAWARSHILQLHDRGIVSPSENYRPFDNLTREEFVKMLVVLAQLDITGKPTFVDVNGNEWFAPYLAAAQKANIVNGLEDGTFGVGSNITRQDMMVMAYRTVEIMNKTLITSNEAVQSPDFSEISEYAVMPITRLQQAGVISGMENGNIEPFGLSNRAQAAVVVCNLINAMKGAN